MLWVNLVEDGSMSDVTIDLDGYFERIGYGGGAVPTLETLQALVTHHTRTIPFENLNPLLGRPVKIDVASLEEKLVHNGRGGYCFEQNGLFSAVLKQLGYAVTDLAARVVIGREAEAPAALTHQFIRVDLDGHPYMVDVGFGGMTLPSPIRFDVEGAQETLLEPYRLVQRSEVYWLEALVMDEWRPMYRFRMQGRERMDYVVGNWYVSTHPESGFVTGLTAARLADGQRFALRNGRFSIHTLGEESEIRKLEDVEALLDVLENVMGITLPQNWGLAERVHQLLNEQAES